MVFRVIKNKNSQGFPNAKKLKALKDRDRNMVTIMDIPVANGVAPLL